MVGFGPVCAEGQENKKPLSRLRESYNPIGNLQEFKSPYVIYGSPNFRDCIEIGSYAKDPRRKEMETS